MDIACFIFFIILTSSIARDVQPPNIVIILADDLGWNDVGFHGSNQIPTPNIDALGYNGLILNQHYTPSLCTPSRSALLTGKYPIHTGMQHLVILESEPWGLGLNETIFPQALSKAGYRSHAVGKWHLGFYRKEYTPIYRGFESHFGYWQGFHDYYNHSVRATYEPYDGYDMRRNLEVDWSAMGKYSTDLFTQEAVNVIEEHNTKDPLFLYLAHLAPHTGNMREPFQAPDETVGKLSHIQDPERRVYAAMVSKLDDSVGDVVAALKAKNMLDNTVIVFLADNGAPTHGIHSNRGSNYPLRGIKNSAWEGGNRGAAVIWSPLIKKPQRVANQLMYITDWLPTFYAMAGLDVKDLGNIDGVDMWQALSEDLPSPRDELVYNIDDIDNPYAAVRKNDWKYVIGSATGKRNGGWYGESGRAVKTIYNSESILMSKSGIAISAFIIKEQIQRKIRNSNENEFKLELLDVPKMLDLRAEAEIICTTGNTTEIKECNPLEAPCLFNLRQDPCEKVNLAEKHPLILQNLESLLASFRATMIKARNVPNDLTADPAFWNNTWAPWQDELEKRNEIVNLVFTDSANKVVYGITVIFCVMILVFVFPKYFVYSKKSMENTVSVISLNEKHNKTEKSEKD